MWITIKHTPQQIRFLHVLSFCLFVCLFNIDLKTFCAVWNSPHVLDKTRRTSVQCSTSALIYSRPGLWIFSIKHFFKKMQQYEYFCLCCLFYWINLKYHSNWLLWIWTSTEKKMEFSKKNFFSKCDQIRRKLRVWSYIIKKPLMENLIFCPVFLVILPVLNVST